MTFDVVNIYIHNKMKVSIVGRREIAKETWEIQFLRPKNFVFTAGQFMEIVLPKLGVRDPRGNHRVFSIVSSPQNKRFLIIAFRKGKSGFKKTLLGLKKGSTVEINGPFGQFTLPEKPKEQLVFIAGGIGITPFMSMVRYIGESKKKCKVIMFAINREVASIPYRDELYKLYELYNFQLVSYIGHPTKKEFLGIPGIKKSKIYVAGPPGMVRGVVAALRGAGFSQKDVIFEEFSGYL